MARKRKTRNSVEVEPRDTKESPAEKQQKSEEEQGAGDANVAKGSAPPFTALPLRQVHRLIEPGPILLVSTGSVADGSHNLMTLGFHMMLQHSGPTLIGICLGPWDASFEALRVQKQCVLAVPSVEMAGAVVDIGNCSKADGDSQGNNKWATFGLTPLPGQAVQAPLVGGAHIMANVECVVHDRQLVGRYSLWILKAVRAWWDEDMVQSAGRMLHHRGNGVFSVSGDTVVDLHERMTKWPELA
ncbi:flavin reductase domain protein fmN-binding protein [Sporothrix brasiliensis 5110]|uniref:Flavin reductase domain protein fmN-binding protein n=1 Tax=Sporothrix brasiliensis 5110 TaxID=1398154 RepID=A0A0C2II71_9PEZI|nr:flavin reductase domain protein fmN-binding protein [Sporothrix brasiliensis 5110]KIH88896.1 flavin reductase domain protein fmN-binding protein [Sporothrix brasiliensis 5110]